MPIHAHPADDYGVSVFFWVDAVRECFEEVGLLFAHTHDDELIDID
ncbi:MAG: hypothetical protein JSU95_03560 [Betaproteobacteria bacterium]|nr:MAG: hypothetical protein JSU95_03560 [Betaproteobacteria bacterium]